jgi:hypothetical protein
VRSPKRWWLLQDDVFDWHGDGLRLDLVDLRLLSVRLGKVQRVMTRSGDREWRAWLPLPSPGRHSIRLAVMDFAQNSSELQAELRLPKSATEAPVINGQRRRDGDRHDLCQR